MSNVTSTAQGRQMLADAKVSIEEGAKNYAVKEITGTPFRQQRFNGKVTRIDPIGSPRLGGVANTLSVVGDILLLHEVGAAFASDDPAGALNDLLCGFGSPACNPFVGQDGVNSYYRDEHGNVFAVPNA